MSKKLTAGHLPTAPGFWDSLAGEYDAAHANDRPPGTHEGHNKRSVAWLMHPSHCPSCGERKIRWMARQPEWTHVGRNGRRLARQWEVK